VWRLWFMVLLHVCSWIFMRWTKHWDEQRRWYVRVQETGQA
jgi:hypothetical protein